MSNSPLADVTILSPNYSDRAYSISRITIHHMAGKMTADGCGNWFKTGTKSASSNYGIGYDGKIGLYVPENKRAWTSSSRDNDNRAVTIELSNSSVGGNWPVSDTVINRCIELCADICKRNGIGKLVYTGTTSGNLTRHDMFAETNCPGPYLGSKLPYIADEVNKRLGGTGPDTPVKPYTVRITTKNLNIRTGPGVGYQALQTIAPGVYTIVEEADGQGAGKWGKLKSGAGWIALDYVTKL